MDEKRLTKVFIKNDILGKDLHAINVNSITNNKVKSALIKAQKANDSLTNAFDEVFSKENQDILAEVSDMLDEEIDKVID